MSNTFKTVFEFPDVTVLDAGDYLLLWDTETGQTRRVSVTVFNDLVGAGLTVNAKPFVAGAVTINADEVDDTSTVNKFVTAAEKALIAYIRDDLSSNVYLDGTGNYSSPALISGQILNIDKTGEDTSTAFTIDMENTEQVSVAYVNDTAAQVTITIDNVPVSGFLDISIYKKNAANVDLILQDAGGQWEFRKYDAGGTAGTGNFVISGSADTYATLSIKFMALPNPGGTKAVATVAQAEEAT